jgi:hypothetical protein
MISVNFLAVQNLTSGKISIGDLGFSLDAFEAKDILGMFTLKQIMDSGGLWAFLDQQQIMIQIQLNDDVKELRSAGSLRAALKDVVKCHTCGKPT